MTKNEVDIIKNSVLDATEAYVDARLANANFVKTQIGEIIHSAKSSETDPTKSLYGKYLHKVRCNATRANPNGTVYSNVLSVGNVRFPNKSIVFLVAPNAQYSNQFILGKLDSSPANIVGGEIHIGEIPSGVAHPSNVHYYFNVDSEGNVNIYSGSIKLGYNSTHHNYNFIVDSNGIKLGITSSTAHNFTVDNNGNVSIKSGSINIGNGNFNVDTSGNVTCKNLTADVGGKIGCFNINSSSLYSGTSVVLSNNIMACGHAGDGIAVLHGNIGGYGAYVQVSDSGSTSTCISGYRIFANGRIQHYDSDGNPDWYRSIVDIPT